MPTGRGEQTPTVAQLEHDVLTVRADQRAQQHHLEEAVSCELRALGALDSARAVQGPVPAQDRRGRAGDLLAAGRDRPHSEAAPGVTRRISCALDLCMWPALTTFAAALACVDDRLLRWLRDVPVDDEPDVIG